METTCRELVPGPWEHDRVGLAGVSATGRTRVTRVCGAPIPRLVSALCEVCGEDCYCEPCDETGWLPDTENGGFMRCPLCVNRDHTRVGPLASECSRGHPVAVPTDLHALADKALDALERNKNFDTEEWAHRLASDVANAND